MNLWIVWEEKTLEVNLLGVFTSKETADFVVAYNNIHHPECRYYYDVGNADVIGGFPDVGWNF